MKKVFANRISCAHVWAAQSQAEGRAGNVFFDGPTIYSYGRHFPIASFQRGIVLYNCDGYSNSTAKHKLTVASALYGLGVKRIDVSKRFVTGDDPKGCLEDFGARREVLLLKAAGARSRTESYLAEADMIESQARDYAQAFKLRAPKFKPFERERFAAMIAKQRAAAKLDNERRTAEYAEREKRYRERAAKREAQYPIVLDAWRRRELLPREEYSTIDCYSDKPTELRLSKDGASVETSRGADVPIRDAKLLWTLIHATRLNRQPITDTAQFGDVGAFRLREIDADGNATIGCHTLTYVVTRAFAESQGWPV